MCRVGGDGQEMKTKKEIQEMISKCQRLRRVISHYSYFGADNWKVLDDNVEALTKCLVKSEKEIEMVEQIRLAALDELDQDWCEDGKIRAYDWVLEKADDGLVTDEDLECFEKEVEENE